MSWLTRSAQRCVPFQLKSIMRGSSTSRRFPNISTHWSWRASLLDKCMSIALIERFFGRRQEPVGDEASRREVASIHKSRRILYLQFTDPAAYPPLEHSSRLLADRGWEVLFLGASTRGESALRLPNHPSIRAKEVRRARGGWGQKV